MRFARALGALIVGSLLVATAYWGLLNVPESNVLALVVSALLVIAIVLLAGVTLAFAVAECDGMPVGHSLRRAVAALPLFIVGVLLFAALWYATTAFDTWWGLHRGEVDALFLRYLGFTRTAPLHTGLAWLVWLVRWVVGVSAVVGLVTVATLQGAGRIGAGLRLSVRLLPLAAATVALLVVTQTLWRLAPWRPASLAPTPSEVYFSAVKLSVLYLLTATIATAVLGVYQRAARRT